MNFPSPFPLFYNSFELKLGTNITAERIYSPSIKMHFLMKIIFRPQRYSKFCYSNVEKLKDVSKYQNLFLALQKSIWYSVKNTPLANTVPGITISSCFWKFWVQYPHSIRKRVKYSVALFFTLSTTKNTTCNPYKQFLSSWELRFSRGSGWHNLWGVIRLYEQYLWNHFLMLNIIKQLCITVC